MTVKTHLRYNILKLWIERTKIILNHSAQKEISENMKRNHYLKGYFNIWIKIYKSKIDILKKEKKAFYIYRNKALHNDIIEWDQYRIMSKRKHVYVYI